MGFFGDPLGILSEFFGNSLEILWKLLGNCIRILYEFLRNSMGVLGYLNMKGIALMFLSRFWSKEEGRTRN